MVAREQFEIDCCQCSGDVDRIGESCLQVVKRFPAAFGFQVRLHDFHAARPHGVIHRLEHIPPAVRRILVLQDDPGEGNRRLI